MPRTRRIKSTTHIYHITLRAINRQQIFEEASDYQIFLASLARIVERYPLWIHAYCLMGNHVHMLVEAPKDSISFAMKALEDSFVYCYNQEHERVGILFQGRFHSVPVETKAQFLNTLRYIHQNPMRAGIEEKPGTYPWSSYHRYFHPAKKELLCRERVLGYFPQESDLHEYLDTPLDANAAIRVRGKRPISDQLAIQLMCELSGANGLTELQSLSKDQRNQLLRDLYRHHIPVSITGRILGISRTQIYRILKAAGMDANRM